MTASTGAISVSGLTKTYQHKEVLKNVTFSVPYGSIYTLLGSNGAGKTTTIRILTDQIRADSGQISICGFNIPKESAKMHEVISLTGQFTAIDELLTGRENLIFMAKLRHHNSPRQKADELLTLFNLTAAAHRPVSSYSGGMKRRLDIAMSLIGSPRIIFLDEPTTGLDPQSRRSLWQMIKNLNASGTTIFLTTQYLEEAENLSDTIGILDKGSIIAEGSVAQLKSYLPQRALQFIFYSQEDLKTAKTILSGCKTAVAPKDCQLTIFTDNSICCLTESFRKLQEYHIQIRDFTQQTPNLEDVFLSVIAKENMHENNSSISKIHNI